MAIDPEQIRMMALGRPAVAQFADFAIGPVSLRRIFLLLTRLHYSDSANYGPLATEFKNFTWHKDPALSKLKIELDFAFKPELTESTPAVFVGLGDFDYKQKVMDNRSGQTEDGAGNNNVLEGVTTVILRHASQKPDEALALGELSFGYYTGIRELLMQKMQLRAFVVNKLTTPQFFNTKNADQAHKSYFSDLILGLSFSAAWTTFRESHRIKTITFGQILEEFD